MNIDDRDARQPVAATESTVGRQCRLGGGTELACRIDAIETIPALPAGYRVLVHHWIAVWDVYRGLTVFYHIARVPGDLAVYYLISL